MTEINTKTSAVSTESKPVANAQSNSDSRCAPHPTPPPPPPPEGGEPPPFPLNPHPRPRSTATANRLQQPNLNSKKTTAIPENPENPRHSPCLKLPKHRQSRKPESAQFTPETPPA